MTKEEVIAYLKEKRKETCTQCTSAIFSVLMDPLTQAALPELAAKREGWLDLHAHLPIAFSQALFHACFLTWLEVGEDTYMPYFTPAAPTVLKAIEYLNEALEREQHRRHGGVSPAASKTRRRKTA